MAGRSQSRVKPSPEPFPESSPDDGSTAPGSSGAIVDLLVVFAVVFLVYHLALVVGLGLVAGLFVLSPPVTDNLLSVVTSVYAHQGLGHLLSNSIALVVFGWPVARATTRVRFHAFFLLTGAIAGLSQIVLTNAAAAAPILGVPGTGGVIGASGGVFALLGYLIASNRLSAGLASFVEVPRWLTAVVFVGLAAAVTLATAGPGIALLAHFTGFLVGMLAGSARILHVGTSARR